MSKRRQDVRERARQVMLAQQEAARRRQRMAIAGASVAVVLFVVAIFVVVRVLGSGSASGGSGAQPASADLVSKVTNVPQFTLDTVGRGAVDTPPQLVTGTPLKLNGKPLVVYLGAEYCPYCAAERWAVVVALSRFGTFSNLGATHSSSTDVFPDTATLSFHGASYTSQYLAFQGVEEQSNTISGGNYEKLDTPTAQQTSLMAKYDAPPYVPSQAAGAIPFIDLGNVAMIVGASYSPSVLAGLTTDQIAAKLSDPASPVAQAIDGTANAITAVLCKMTGGQPTSVCRTASATAYQNLVNGGSG